MAESNTTTNPETQAAQQSAESTQSEKTFTQAELDAIVARRLAKAQKGMPDEAELTAFRSWKESQQTEQQRWDALTKERDAAKNDLTAALAKVEQYEREKLLLSKGVPAEDVDYYAFKAGKLVNDTMTFEQAADAIISARQSKGTETVRIDFGAPLNGGAPAMTVDEIMKIQDDAERQKMIAKYHHLFGF